MERHLPWKWEDMGQGCFGDGSRAGRLVDSGGASVFAYSNDVAAADAAFVVTAVNHYDELVAMVERLEDALEAAIDAEFTHCPVEDRPSAKSSDLAAARALLVGLARPPSVQHVER